jgi:hypothetical protein
VVGTDGDDVTVVSRDGRATLQLTGDDIFYRRAAADVLGLGASGARGERDWLVHSLDGPYPDAPAQLVQLFRSGRTGDLVVIGEPGTDLRLDWEIPEHRSGHGSLIADHMRCLVAANVPITGPLRTVDLFPLILDWLGIPVPAAIDGALPVVEARA